MTMWEKIVLNAAQGRSTAAPRFEAGRSTVVVRAGQVLGRFSAGSGQFLAGVGSIWGAQN